MDLLVERVVTDHRNYTLGVIELPDINLFVLERAWLNNANEVSCIPADCRYTLEFNEEKDLWYLRNYSVRIEQHLPDLRQPYVTCRWGIRIGDIANRYDEIQGCLALGMGVSWIGDFPNLQNSRVAHDAFNTRLKNNNEPHTLEIQ